MKVERTYLMPNTRCLACARPFDAASGGNTHPNEGDVSICAYCAHLMIYKKDGTVRNPTDDELADTADDARVQQAIMAVRNRNEKPTS